MRRYDFIQTTNISKVCSAGVRVRHRACPGMLACLLLSACALVNDGSEHAPPPAWLQHRDQILAIEHWELRGTVDLHYRKQRWRLNMRWACARQSVALNLYTVRGDKLMEMQITPHEARAKNRQGQVYTAQNGADLAQELLGVRAPVDSLCQWLIGLVDVHGAEPQTEFDRQGRLLMSVQSDWHLRYQDYEEHRYGGVWISMPRRLILRKGDMRITLSIAERAFI